MAYLLYLQHLISRPDIYSIVEIGFGDWEVNQHLILEHRSYTGYEVALPMMRKSEYNTEYRLTDRVQSVREKGDLLIIREVMQHWPNREIEYVMKYMIKRYRYALLTNGHTTSTKPTPDIKQGGWRVINLGGYPDMNKVLSVDFGINKKVSFLYINPDYHP